MQVLQNPCRDRMRRRWWWQNWYTATVVCLDVSPSVSSKGRENYSTSQHLRNSHSRSSCLFLSSRLPPALSSRTTQLSGAVCQHLFLHSAQSSHTTPCRIHILMLIQNSNVNIMNEASKLQTIQYSATFYGARLAVSLLPVLVLS